MDEEFSNVSVANMTLQSNTTMSFDIRAPRGQQYACVVYLFVTAGIVQLIISAIGLVGKARYNVLETYYFYEVGIFLFCDYCSVATCIQQIFHAI